MVCRKLIVKVDRRAAVFSAADTTLAPVTRLVGVPAGVTAAADPAAAGLSPTTMAAVTGAIHDRASRCPWRRSAFTGVLCSTGSSGGRGQSGFPSPKALDGSRGTPDGSVPRTDQYSPTTSPFSSMSMCSAAGCRLSPGMVRMSPQMA